MRLMSLPVTWIVSGTFAELVLKSCLMVDKELCLDNLLQFSMTTTGGVHCRELDLNT